MLRDGIEWGYVAEVKNVFKGVGDLLSLASANAFKGDAVSTVRCGSCMPRKFGEIMQWHSSPKLKLGRRAHCVLSI